VHWGGKKDCAAESPQPNLFSLFLSLCFEDAVI